MIAGTGTATALQPEHWALGSKVHPENDDPQTSGAPPGHPWPTWLTRAKAADSFAKEPEGPFQTWGHRPFAVCPLGGKERD